MEDVFIFIFKTCYFHSSNRDYKAHFEDEEDYEDDDDGDVVLPNNYDDNGNTVGGGTTPFGFGSDTTLKLADNQVKFLIHNQTATSTFSGFQSTYIEDKYQIILGNLGISRVGLIESIEIAKSGTTPITWNATLNFVAGAVIAAEPE